MRSFANLLLLELALEELHDRLTHEVRTRPMTLVDGDLTIDVAPLWEDARDALEVLLKRVDAASATAGKPLEFKALWPGTDPQVTP